MSIKRAAYEAGYRWARLRANDFSEEYAERVRQQGMKLDVLSFNQGIKSHTLKSLPPWEEHRAWVRSLPKFTGAETYPDIDDEPW